MICIKPIKTQVDKGFEKLIKKFTLETSINVEAIDAEIERLLNIDTRKKGKVYIENIENTLDYLEDTKEFYIKHKDRIHEKIKINYTYKDGEIRSTPINMVNIPLFNIESHDFINIAEGILMDISYEYMLLAMAYTFIYRELGKSLDDVEKTLEDVSLVIINDSDILKKLIDSDISYKEIKGFKIGECPYLNPNRKTIFSFFLDEVKIDDGKYWKVLEKSSKKLMSIVINSILDEVKKYANDISIAGVSETGIKLLVKKESLAKEVEEILNVGVGLQIFGRNFRFIPDIKVIRNKKEEKKQ